MNIEQFINRTPIGGRFDHLDYALIRRPIIGEVVECGVYAGNSLNHIAERVPHVWGFDSFEGLPEAWEISPTRIRQAGTFKCKPPSLPNNVRLVKGLFQQTIPEWIALYKEISNKAPMLSLLHVDCDLYQSAMDVLRGFDECIHPGTVVVFDELGNWPGGNLWYESWADGEYKALNDWLEERNRMVDVLGRDNQHAASVVVTA